MVQLRSLVQGRHILSLSGASTPLHILLAVGTREAGEAANSSAVFISIMLKWSLRLRPILGRHANRKGFSIVEIVCSLSLLSVGMLGVEAMQVRALANSDAGQLQRQAVEIARNQLDSIQQLPEGQLDVDGEFGPAAWLHSPGLEAGPLPSPLRAKGGPEPLEVEVRVADRDDAREFAVRVKWVDPDGDARVHEVNTVRASQTAVLACPPRRFITLRRTDFSPVFDPAVVPLPRFIDTFVMEGSHHECVLEARARTRFSSSGFLPSRKLRTHRVTFFPVSCACSAGQLQIGDLVNHQA